MLTYWIWTNKYYSKEDYEEFNFCRDYSYNFRLFMCILFTIFAIPLDIVAWPIELIVWLVNTFNEM